MSEIVVGLDASPASRSALAWAAHQARLTKVSLRAVHALIVSPILTDSMGLMSTPVSAVPDDRIEKAYREAVVAVWQTVHPEPSWRLEFYHADIGRLLVEQSAAARMLVIGTREHVGWGRILSGSVSHYCLSHSACPVVAVPAATDSASDDEPDQPTDDEPDKPTDAGRVG
jgi:nucleotide-binding universal stress UspA family protein